MHLEVYHATVDARAPLALNYLATMRTFAGDLDDAAVLVEEADAIADAIGNAPICSESCCLPDVVVTRRAYRRLSRRASPPRLPWVKASNSHSANSRALCSTTA